jgi:hypothetical protein
MTTIGYVKKEHIKYSEKNSSEVLDISIKKEKEEKIEIQLVIIILLHLLILILKYINLKNVMFIKQIQYVL